MIDHPGSEAFRRILDPADNATGGGAAAAIAGAMAAALLAMVARLSVGKGLPKPDTFYTAVAAEAETISRQLLAGADDDAQAFDAVRAAYQLPRSSEAQRQERSRAIQSALVHATYVPLTNAEHCQRVLQLCRMVQDHCNPNVISDLECAGLLAYAGQQGCLSNVETNLRAIKDTETRAKLARRAECLREGIPVSDISL
ncbi:MAG: formiminotransferase-cyclodeaminase [Ardenticatenia bacterium]|nr:MAG: formiminotransferase-cyclodeaminase [Ardenticatenia bacterium]